MRLFNAWKPARKDGRPVRQVLNYAVLFRANEPVIYEQGKAIVYYDASFRPINNALTANYLHTLPIDTLTGLPNGELTFYETRNGKRGKEVRRFPLIRNEIKAQKPGEAPQYQLGHKQKTSDWVNLIYTIRADGSLVRVGPPDRTEGLTVTYRPNGLVESVQDFSTKKVTSWFPNGQLKTIVVESPDDVKSTKSYYRLISAWDSTGKATVVDGNGYHIHRTEVTSRSDSTKKTAFVEEGTYVDGYHEGIWKGRYADGSYSYEEQFNQGQCLGGKAVINGTVRSYKDSRKNPEFKGGTAALYAFLDQTIRYPSDASRQGASGKVFVTFIVCTDGTLCDYEILKGVYPSLDAEALRVVKEASGRWNPGFQRGEPVRVRYNLPISFQLN
jgi:TonB family protein